MTHQTQVPSNNQMSAIDRIPDEAREGMEKPLNRLATTIEAERNARAAINAMLPGSVYDDTEFYPYD